MRLKYDVIVCGNCFVDLVFGHVPRMPGLGEEVYADQFVMTGGGYYISAVALARLGLSVAIITRLGSDSLSEWLRRKLELEGVSTELIYQVPNSYCNVTAVMSQPHDRAFLSHVTDDFQQEFVEHAVRMLEQHVPRAIHISALPYVTPVVKAAKANGVFVSMDVAWHPEWFHEKSFLDLIGSADLLIPNEKEALAISGTPNVQAAVHWLHALVPNVIVKCGSSGCVYQTSRETRPVHVPTAPEPCVVDTTGAGDNFDAGVLLGLLDGQSYWNSCLLGNYCGKASLRGLGGTERSVTRDSLNEYFLQNYGWTVSNQHNKGVI
jgi:sugar/nucleoside kinase (ribokinase family)